MGRPNTKACFSFIDSSREQVLLFADSLVTFIQDEIYWAGGWVSLFQFKNCAPVLRFGTNKIPISILNEWLIRKTERSWEGGPQLPSIIALLRAFLLTWGKMLPRFLLCLGRVETLETTTEIWQILKTFPETMSSTFSFLLVEPCSFPVFWFTNWI